jgi:hypothetical protein
LGDPAKIRKKYFFEKKNQKPFASGAGRTIPANASMVGGARK